MTITLSAYDYKRIINGCAPALDKYGAHPPLAHIEITHDGSGTAYATALDGYVMAQIRFACEGDAGTFLMPCIRFVPRKHADISITWDDETVSVSDGETTITRFRPTDTDVNRKGIVQGLQAKEMRYTIAVNPRNLLAALKAHNTTDHLVVFEFASDIDAIVIRSKDASGLVLPIRILGDSQWDKLARLYDMPTYSVGGTDTNVPTSGGASGEK